MRLKNKKNKTGFYFINNNKDNIRTEVDEKDYRNIFIYFFCEKEYICDKIRDQCQLTEEYRGPAHSKSNINVKQSQNIFIPITFHSFFNYDCHLFFKKLVEKNDKAKFDIIPRSKEKFISITYICIRLIDYYRFLPSSLYKSVETLVDNSHKTLTSLKKMKLKAMI